MGILFDFLQDLPVSAALNIKLQDFEAKHEKLQIEHDRIKEENEWLKAELNRLTKKDKLEDLEKNILILLSDSTTRWLAEHVGEKFSISTTRAEHVLKTLSDRGFASLSTRLSRGAVQRRYSLSDEGRAYLVSNNLVT